METGPNLFRIWIMLAGVVAVAALVLRWLHA
jgi:hypothetical protein